MPVQRLETGRIIPVSEITPASELPPELTAVKEGLQESKAIVLMDLDKTTIDASYNLTNLKGLQEAITHLQDNSVLVGIHSDSPRETDIQFAKMFGAKGPLVYEMAGMHFPWAGLDLILDNEALEFFTSFRDRLYESLRTTFPDKDGEKYLIANDRDKNKEKREGKTYPGFTQAIFINPLRRFSLGLWVEGIAEDGAPYLDEEFHRQVNQATQTLIASHPGFSSMEKLDWDFNPDYGVIIVKKKALSSKTPPLQAILSLTEDYQGPVYMIGDSPADYIDDPRVTTLAVANAKDALKEILKQQTSPLPEGITRISQGSYTEGVIEHLQAIGKSLEAFLA